MNKFILTLSIVIFSSLQSFAHYMWVETNPNGKVGKSQEVKVFFGEYTYGEIEEANGDAFKKVQNFSLWAIDAQGNKTALKTVAKDTYFVAEFTPKNKGTYTVILDNNNIDVIDYTQYNFGIFKTHYHSVAKIQIGKKDNATATLNDEGITVKDISESKRTVKLQVLYKNKALPKNEVKVYVADLWTKTLTTDENGFVIFNLPWETKYIVETTYKEEAPGKYNNKEYEFIWHCVTYTIL
ncbi:DUF4198 domain-containing protein [Wenyingzhuangia sp. chi5]|uniref:DUF4198 domain-containing protein n=1 Tax=Wenyingzhuangia gilva TaxID=3057677 RepID=A0ABT8VSP9_9FLAO|nr:DUF4198 domain-containing protein [Wenyingzhuangia sp. chi5]MDO3694967.1 DUF4198 domain-containing protein [Wenyingzhuangia sp. chi5]